MSCSTMHRSAITQLLKESLCSTVESKFEIWRRLTFRWNYKSILWPVSGWINRKEMSKWDYQTYSTISRGYPTPPLSLTSSTSHLLQDSPPPSLKSPISHLLYPSPPQSLTFSIPHLLYQCNSPYNHLHICSRSIRALTLKINWTKYI
jgi:hypothetical protein